jgi:hypothetical protein
MKHSQQQQQQQKSNKNNNNTKYLDDYLNVRCMDYGISSKKSFATDKHTFVTESLSLPWLIPWYVSYGEG